MKKRYASPVADIIAYRFKEMVTATGGGTCPKSDHPNGPDMLGGCDDNFEDLMGPVCYYVLEEGPT